MLNPYINNRRHRYNKVLDTPGSYSYISNSPSYSRYSRYDTLSDTPRPSDFSAILPMPNGVLDYKDGHSNSDADTESTPGINDYQTPVSHVSGRSTLETDVPAIDTVPGESDKNSGIIYSSTLENTDENTLAPGESDKITIYASTLENNDANTLESEVLDLEKSLGTNKPFSDNLPIATTPINGQNTVFIILGCIGLSLGISISIGLIVIFIAGIISYRKIKQKIQKGKNELNILYSNHDYEKLETN